MQDWATSIESVSSGVRVPSLREVERKSMMARARRFLESEVDAWWWVGSQGVGVGFGVDVFDLPCWRCDRFREFQNM